MSHSSTDSNVSSRRRHRIAGGSLALSAAAVGAVVALGGSAATAPASAQTDHGRHAQVVTVHIRNGESISEFNASLARRYHETVTLDNKPGAATNHSPILCTKISGSHPKGPKIRLLAGNGNTEPVPGNSGGGSFHLVSCQYANVGFVSGNSGSAS